MIRFISDPRGQDKQERRGLRNMRPKLIIRPVKDEQPNLTEHEATSLREMILRRARERGLTVQPEGAPPDNSELTGRPVEREEPRLTQEETQGLMNLIEREAKAMGIRVIRSGDSGPTGRSDNDYGTKTNNPASTGTEPNGRESEGNG